MLKLIYVADDERSIRELVREYLVNEGYTVKLFNDGTSLIEAFSDNVPDMIIIDIMMPGLDGLSVCRNIRARCDIPIIIISAKDEEVDIILGLELGGDDYLSKPFSPRELVVRVKNLFNRLDRNTKAQNCQVIRFDDLIVDLGQRTVRKDETSIDLTGKEMDLLTEFAGSCGRVFTRDQLIKKIWGYEFIGETRAVDDLVKRIRRKLKDAGSAAEIETVWGYGYKAVEGGNR
jgi:DNA-binding response OmpR family regulator